MIKKLILSTLISLTALGCSNQERISIVQVITTSTGKKIEYECRKNVVSCMAGGLTENRAIKTTDGFEYVCNFENQLFLIKNSDDGITNIPQGKCTYQVFERIDHIDGTTTEKEII